LVKQQGSLVHDTFSSTSAPASDVENQREETLGCLVIFTSERVSVVQAVLPRANKRAKALLKVAGVGS
jgi:hypothetical protein